MQEKPTTYHFGSHQRVEGLSPPRLTTPSVLFSVLNELNLACALANTLAGNKRALYDSKPDDHATLVVGIFVDSELPTSGLLARNSFQLGP